MYIPPLNLFNYSLIYKWIDEMATKKQEDVWTPVIGRPGFEKNQRGQLRGTDITKTSLTDITKKKKDPPYKPFQGDEWPDHNPGEIPENFV